MNRAEAKDWIKENLNIGIDDLGSMGDYVTLVRIRHESPALPKFGVDGSSRDESEWAFFDAAEKIDSGLYGCWYFFGNRAGT